MKALSLTEIVTNRVVLANEGREKQDPYNSNNNKNSKKHHHSKSNSLELLQTKNCQKVFPTMCNTTNNLKPLEIKSCEKASSSIKKRPVTKHMKSRTTVDRVQESAQQLSRGFISEKVQGWRLKKRCSRNENIVIKSFSGQV